MRFFSGRPISKLSTRFPKQIGFILGPNARFNPHGFPYAVDNGRFIACVAANGYPKTHLPGGTWDSHRFKLLLDSCARRYPPEWVVVPDIVGDCNGTLSEWSVWAPWIQEHYGFNLAIAVQDGMTPEHIEPLLPAPTTIFVGGTYWWKRNTVPTWCKAFPRVHVGRVNSLSFLWECSDAGADSVDGTGWFRGGPARLEPLTKFLNGVRE